MEKLNRFIGYMLMVCAVVMFASPAINGLDTLSSIGCLLMGTASLMGSISLLSVNWKKILGVAVLFIAFTAQSCSSSGHLKDLTDAQYDSIAHANDPVPDSLTFRSKVVTFIEKENNYFMALPADHIEIVKVPYGYRPGDTLLITPDFILEDDRTSKVINYRVLLTGVGN